MQTNSSNTVKRWLPVTLWGMVILVLSLMPGGPGNLNLFGIPYFDKVGHFGMYAVWTFLFYHALSGDPGRSKTRSFWISILLGAITGVILEFAQNFMNQGRSYEVADMVANGVGAMVGGLLGLYGVPYLSLKKK